MRFFSFLFLMTVLINKPFCQEISYVTNSNDNTVSVIDVSSETETNTIGVGANPLGIAFSPDGTVAYVVNNIDNTVSVINTSTETVTNTIGVGSTPNGVAFSPDGSVAYVTNNGASDVSVINITSETVTNTIGVGSDPYGIAFKSAARTVSGICSQNEFFTQIELFNIISWTPVNGAVKFIIYRDASLSIIAGETTSSTFIDHNRRPNRVENYFVTFINSAGTEVFLGQTSVSCSL